MDKHIFTFIFLIINFISTGQQSFQKEGKYGFVSNGQVIIEATYDYASDFSRGLACVKLNGKWGYINALGEFVIEPIYDKVEVFRTGYAQIMKDGLIGLIDSTGTEILPPKYTKIEIVSNGFKTHLGKKVGFFKLGWKEVSPKYSRIYYDNGFISASGLNGYDIYTKKGLVLENQKQGFSKWSFKKDGGIIATKDDLFGIYSVDGWLLEPKYDKIVAFPCNEYSEVNYLGEVVEDLNFFYAGFNNLKDVDISYYSKSFNLDGKDQSVAFLKAGSFNNLFGEISSFSYNDDRNGYDHNHVYEVVVNSEKITFSDNFKEIVPSINVSGYNITINETPNIISHPSKSVHFEADSIVPFYLGIEDSEMFDEWGELIDAPQKKILHNGFVMVFEDTCKYLLQLNTFDRKSPKLPLDSKVTYTVNEFNTNDLEYVFFYSQNSKRGMFSQRMYITGTAMVYENIEFVNDNLFKTSEVNSNKQQVFSVRNVDTCLIEVDDAWNSDQWNLFDIETNELISKFNQNFVILKEDDSYGIINSYNQIVLPQFDTIIAMDLANFVAVKKGGKFGCLNLKTRHITPIIYDEIPDLEVIDVYHYLIKGKHESEYRDQFGYKWLSKFKPYIDEDENGNICLKTTNIFGEKVVTYETNDSKIHIEESESSHFYYKYGDNGKLGAIDAFGNEIIPCIYSDIEFDFRYEVVNGLQEEYLKTTLKGKSGVITTRGKVIVPNNYAYVSEFDNEGFSSGIIVGKGKKQGLYSSVGEMILPCEYKSIQSSGEYVDNDSRDIVVINKKKKIGIIDKTGEVVLPIEFDDLYSRDKPYFPVGNYGASIITVKKGNKIGVFDLEKGMIIPPIYDKIDDYTYGDDEYELSAYMVTNKNEIGVYSYSGKQLLPCEFMSIKTSVKSYLNGKSKHIVKAEKEGKVYLSVFDFDGTNAMGYDDIGAFDHFSGWYGYAMLEDSTFLKTNIVTGVKENVGKTFIMEGDLFDIYMEDGKFGVKSKRGNVLIEPIYDKASFWEGNSEVMIGYENDIMYYIYPSTNERYTEAEWLEK